MSELPRGNQGPGDEPITHHGPPGGGAGRVLLAAAIVVLLVAVAGGTTWWMYSRDPAPTSNTAGLPERSPSAATCAGVKLRVAAAPEIAPVVSAAAKTLDDDPANTCDPIEVVAEEPGYTVAAAAKPDVWIPSSSAWLSIANAGGAAFATDGKPLAHSPIMLAAPAVVAKTIAKGDRTSWAQLTGAAAAGKLSAVTMPDAQYSTTGLLSVYGVNAAMARTTPDAGIAQLRALTLRSRLADATADPTKLLARVAEQWNTNGVVYDVGVFPTTEQQLRAYQQGKHTIPLQGAYPVDGQVEADYPFAVAKNNQDVELTAQLRAAITRTSLTKAGFRPASLPNTLPLPAKPRELLAMSTMWSEYKSLSTQVLLLIDASGSMNKKIAAPGGGTTTRAGLLRESGRFAAELFAEDTTVGMWFFGQPTPSSPPHKEVVSYGPITAPVAGKTRREALAKAMIDYRAADNSGTPLYKSVLDGVAEMREKVSPGTVTLVVVLTDGEDGESTFKMTQSQFMTKLAAEQDPSRPVPVLALGYGPDVDMQALTAMSEATGGKAFPATDPADLSSAIAKAFLAAHAPR
ncbi:substrate-binding and VWA domain-containing protein [Actinoplanes sp. TRM 88003]|uniref:Substrate-binding and VWA domain-containing protein n=1 Tax=Paractinoplanes aksuensis TaxID=2939490 RepID=A0ABT1DZA0_9ACTN|nr:substrate-binding domain-containing protein [Actinoplanes aksuensis]MCO8276112.1 substrate-binding and VWA domain-containing protein [Actinoplanes aksuensis]